MKIKWLLAVLPMLACSLALAVDQDRFAWSFEVLAPPTAPVMRLSLTPEQISALNREDARDWQVIDSQGRVVPAALLPASALLESRSETTELAFEQTLMDSTEDPPSPLTLAIGHGLTRVQIEAPDRRRLADDGRLVFQALIAAPGPGEPAERRWLNLSLQADQRVVLDCRFGDAEAEHAGIDRFAFQEVGDARPRRYQGREPVAVVPSAWHLSCFAAQALPGLSLVRATLEEERRIDHRRRELIEPSQIELVNGGQRLDFDLPGPFLVDGLRLISRQTGLFSQLQLQSRGNPEQGWRERVRITLSTLDDDAEASMSGLEPVRARHWQALATPPLPQAPNIELQVRVEEIAFLPQGEGPWRLLSGGLEPGEGHMSASVLAELISRQGPAWTWPLLDLSERQQAAGPAALEPPRAPIPWQRYLLWAVLVGACLLVLGMAVRLLRGS